MIILITMEHLVDKIVGYAQRDLKIYLIIVHLGFNRRLTTGMYTDFRTVCMYTDFRTAKESYDKVVSSYKLDSLDSLLIYGFSFEEYSLNHGKLEIPFGYLNPPFYDDTTIFPYSGRIIETIKM